MKARRAGVGTRKRVDKLYDVAFMAKAEEGSRVFLAGSFNQWDQSAIAMKHNGDHTFVTTVKLPPGRHEYKFVINNVWRIEEQCPLWAKNDQGSFNSVIEVKQVIAQQ
jgi:1,4-alpha-glucan branching enzyme